MTWLLLAPALALLLYGAWRLALGAGSAAALNRLDALFTRSVPMQKLAAASYGADPAQRLELWSPDKASDTLVIFLHGGGWNSGAPEHYRFVARALGRMGHATVLAGYRLVPEGRFPAMLEDSAAAVAWAARNAANHGARFKRLVLIGHSAGAYNAAMLALDPQWLTGEGLSPHDLAGVVAMSGPYAFHPFTNPSAITAMGHVDPPEQTQPISFAGNPAPPMLLVHGTDDTLVRPRNAQRLHAAIMAANGASRLVEIEGRGHAWTIMALARPFDRDARVKALIAEYLEELASSPASVAVQAEMG